MTTNLTSTLFIPLSATTNKERLQSEPFALTLEMMHGGFLTLHLMVCPLNHSTNHNLKLCVTKLTGLLKRRAYLMKISMLHHIVPVRCFFATQTHSQNVPSVGHRKIIVERLVLRQRSRFSGPEVAAWTSCCILSCLAKAGSLVYVWLMVFYLTRVVYCACTRSLLVFAPTPPKVSKGRCCVFYVIALTCSFSWNFHAPTGPTSFQTQRLICA